ncbi:hypothetical protein DH2020_026952 [Rehmannia glutinosa]|uniref:DUF4005 domain-containing protein n=1 Tax=Rehmannia glutinosa TaxID=99300 RepID=A0ABR0VZ11_REHGL
MLASLVRLIQYGLSFINEIPIVLNIAGALSYYENATYLSGECMQKPYLLYLLRWSNEIQLVLFCQIMADYFVMVDIYRCASEKPAQVSSKEPVSTLIVDAPLISNPVPGTAFDRIDNSSFDKGKTEQLARDGLVSSSTKQDEDMPGDSGLPNDSEKIRLEQAATVLQASFRSYQARCAYRSLKGIIRLQAVVRGRLVRRQAIMTLFCLQGIVKLQAISRGHMVRQSSIGNGQCRSRNLVVTDATHQDSCEFKYTRADNLKNAFINEVALNSEHIIYEPYLKYEKMVFKTSEAPGILELYFSELAEHDCFTCTIFVDWHKSAMLLSSSPTAMPLHLQYGPGEPNSAWEWLFRWSTSQVWAPNSKQKEHLKLQTAETEQTKPKCNDRKSRSETVGNDPNHAKAEAEKHKDKGRKLSNQSVKSSQEHPQNGNDKVKRGSKKILKPSGETSNEGEIDVEKPKRHPRKLSKSPVPKFSERTSNTPTGKIIENLAEAAQHNDVKSSIGLSGANSPTNQLSNGLSSEEHPKLVSEKSQDILLVDKDFKDEQISSENHTSSRRISLPDKHDDREVTPESMTRVPSYMATTASSKAKVRLQGSPRMGQDAVDKNSLTRRHSLPSSVNGKLSSSPRVHRLGQANGREGIKTDISLSSSRDVTGKSMLKPRLLVSFPYKAINLF